MREDAPAEVYAAVASARAADRDRELRLSFLLEARDQEVEQRQQLLEKRLRVRNRFEIGGDGRIGAGELAQPFDVVRIRQKAHVEDQIGVERDPVFESERDDGNAQPARVGPGERRADPFLQLPERHARGIPHRARAVAQRGERGALRDDRVGESDAVVAERMAPARLAVAADQRLVVGVEEQHLRPQTVRHELVERGERVAVRSDVRTSIASAARVNPGLVGERDETAREDRRRIVEAAEPEILEGFHCLTLARARQARYDDETAHR